MTSFSLLRRHFSVALIWKLFSKIQGTGTCKRFPWCIRAHSPVAEGIVSLLVMISAWSARLIEFRFACLNQFNESLIMPNYCGLQSSCSPHSFARLWKGAFGMYGKGWQSQSTPSCHTLPRISRNWDLFGLTRSKRHPLFRQMGLVTWRYSRGANDLVGSRSSLPQRQCKTWKGNLTTQSQLTWINKRHWINYMFILIKSVNRNFHCAGRLSASASSSFTEETVLV